MVGTAVLDDAAAWVGLPIAFLVCGLGVGLLVERALGLRLPATALLPLGACSSICVLLPVYELGGPGWLAAALLVALSSAGLLLSRRELAARLSPGPAAAAALAVAALYLAPVVLSGGWSWAGYNFLNDTAIQFLLADELKHHGVAELEGAFSTRSESIRIYLDTAYPLGAHAHLAALATLTGSGVDVIYQSYLTMLMVAATLALAGIARRAGLGPWSAAAAAAVALSSNLIYQFGLQGSVKELAAFMALATAAMLGTELLASERPARAAVAVGIAGAAMLSVFSAAAGPYLLVLAVCVVAAVLLVPSPQARSRLLPTALAGVAAAVVAALPTLISATTFLRVSNVSLGEGGGGSTSPFGQLQKPLDLIQVAGVWLSEDYGLPVSGRIEWRLTQVLAVLVLALAAIAVVSFARRRIAGPFLLLVPAVTAAAAIAPRATPYADAKLLAIASPPIVFIAACGVLSWRGHTRAVAAAAAAAAALGVVGSAAFAYHGVRLAPVPRLQGLEDAVEHVRDRGWVLLDEVEEFGKYYGRNAPNLNVAFEPITPRPAQPFGGGYHVDLDQLEQGYVQGFDAIVTRIGPGTSRPPANFRRVYRNRWYEAWEKVAGVSVRVHLPLQDALDRGATPGCADVRAFAGGAQPGDRIVASPAAETARLPVVEAPDRPPGWPPMAAPPGVVQPRTPGVVERTARLGGGTYDAWVRTSTGRELHVSVDGRRVGTVKGINTQGQWLHAGAAELPPGRHLLRLERPGGGPAPGDGAQSMIGPVALVRRERTGLIEVGRGDAERLCGRRLDWIEIVAR